MATTTRSATGRPGRPNGRLTYAGWDQLSVSIIGLNPSTTYEFQIRAVDYASPINYGAWSSTTSFLSATDTTPPATPAPPTVAASLIAVQVTHTLGLASGGTYNLPLDMDHFDVHIGTSSGFTPSAATLAGKLTANGSMVTGTIPAVGSFATDPFVAAGAAAHVKVVAVDRTGSTRSTVCHHSRRRHTLKFKVCVGFFLRSAVGAKHHLHILVAE